MPTDTHWHKRIPHIKVGPEETPRLQYLRFASISLYPSNDDISLAVSSILKFSSCPSTSLVCAKAECLLRLEELVRQFLISKDSLSIRMLDHSNDPTPLLKEIRDDKISTIIIDANASVSYLILKKFNNILPITGQPDLDTVNPEQGIETLEREGKGDLLEWGQE
ncbi:glutamate receptor ionotropic, kainate 5-like [Chiloscyllium plagiosum]|uniref:glutamate receptor ionotropic, kainate 5-like n=1 Tax=Chiloscyllium plagiosum TaxID=36176 RepID=UPI001CB81BA9|nr:glutamate receptor ionotropic, kainate 5-like [Chiloscyllium plagiosum]